MTLLFMTLRRMTPFIRHSVITLCIAKLSIDTHSMLTLVVMPPSTITPQDTTHHYDIQHYDTQHNDTQHKAQRNDTLHS